jgi:hypothetical protein
MAVSSFLLKALVQLGRQINQNLKRNPYTKETACPVRAGATCTKGLYHFQQNAIYSAQMHEGLKALLHFDVSWNDPFKVLLNTTWEHEILGIWSIIIWGHYLDWWPG